MADREHPDGETLPPTAVEMYERLRRMALGAVANGLTPPPATHPDVSGLVVDLPEPGSRATLVMLTDNTTSLYTSSGGGMIGAGEHPPVARATHEVLAVVQRHLTAFPEPDDARQPADGTVRLHVLSPAGGRHRDIPAAAFWGQVPHELAPVITAAQQVLTVMQETLPT